ncbi:MAG: lmo0937 family membrane protein [Candidatus Moranbacteria bacterium]|nr:lmo0937 family membrane protein [Candidatus Moranbacteria bacterium]
MWTIIAILLILWFFGFISAYTFGGLIHILLIVALVLIIIRLLQGRSVL